MPCLWPAPGDALLPAGMSDQLPPPPPPDDPGGTPPPPPPPPQPVSAAHPAPAAPVAHRDRKWLPLLGILLVIAFVSFGGFVFAGEPRQVVPEGPVLGDPIPVTGSVAIRPAEGWTPGEGLSLTLEGPGVTLEGIRIDAGVAHLDVVGAAGAPQPVDIWNLYVQEFLALEAEQLQTSEQLESFTTATGAQGVRGSYVGVFPGVSSPLEGEISAVLLPDGTGVIADGWAPDGQLAPALEDMQAMVDSLEVG